MVKRFMLYMTQEEGEQKPCVVVSPDELNKHLPYVCVAPITSQLRPLPFRVTVLLDKQEGQIMLDQLQTLPKSQLIRKIGVLPSACQETICALLQKLFAL
ncbi:MAG: type II toxin-antitoxin system PemK/MazF family toxin [Alphaproteobacteria bacterium]|nr:type II toxin-antitoxin system PemK/MazF family toxin [Alphaproteobacteria bacterium]